MSLSDSLSYAKHEKESNARIIITTIITISSLDHPQAKSITIAKNNTISINTKCLAILLFL